MNCGLCGGDDHYESQCEYGLGEDYDASDSEVDYLPSTSDEVIDVPVNEGDNIMQNVQEAAPAMPASYQSKLGIASDLMTLAQSASSGDADTILNAMEKFSKSQLVRFMDITVIGPLLLFWAWRGKLSKGERFMMGLIGAGTVIYNGRNYLKNKKVIQPAELQAIKQELTDAKLSGRY